MTTAAARTGGTHRFIFGVNVVSLAMCNPVSCNNSSSLLRVGLTVLSQVVFARTADEPTMAAVGTSATNKFALRVSGFGLLRDVHLPGRHVAQ
jgi:hypothetical protein